MRASSLLELLKNNKQIGLLVLAVFLLGIGSFVLGTKTFAAYQAAAATEKEIAMMQQSIKDFKDASEFVNAQTFRPVPAANIDDVQADLMLAIKSNKLNLLDYKVVSNNATGQKSSGKGKKDEKASKGQRKGAVGFKAFEIKFSGSYTDTLHLVENFRSRDALIKIMSMRMRPAQGLIETSLVYRIYIK